MLLYTKLYEKGLGLLSIQIRIKNKKNKNIFDFDKYKSLKVSHPYVYFVEFKT